MNKFDFIIHFDFGDDDDDTTWTDDTVAGY